MNDVSSEKKSVLIGPIDIPGKISVESSESFNPGIGGSEMHSIVLANLLSTNFEVTLWARTGPVPKGKFQVVRNPSNFSEFDLQISYTSNAQSESLEFLPLIAISHHPFDGHINSLPTRTVAIANVGRFQLLSNAKKARVRKIKQIWLPVFLRGPAKSLVSNRQGEGLIAGHLSSMHPSKGFLDVLKGWTKFRVRDEVESQLRVLGGISLYGSKESHPTLPTELHFGNKLSREIKGKDAHSIVFLGRVSGDIASEIAKWDIAILNPKGWGESESVSMKDCWRMGVPVIAGNRFGQRDYMSDFPELQASSPRQIARVLKRYQRGKLSAVELSNRAMENYSILEQRGHLSAQKWAELVTVVTEKHPTGLTNCGIPIGKISSSQRIAVWVDHLRITVHLTLIGGLSVIRALLK